MSTKLQYSVFLSLVLICWAGTSSAQPFYSDTSTFDSYAALYNKILLDQNNHPVVFGSVVTGFNPMRDKILFTKRQMNGQYQVKILCDSSRRTYFVLGGINLNGNGYAILGTVVVPISSTNSVKRGLVFFTNSDGDSIRYTEFEGLLPTDDFRIVDGVHFANKTFIFAENIRIFSTTSENQIALLVLDSTGNLIHKKQFGLTGKREYPGRIIRSASGNLILGSVRSHVESPFQNISFQTWILEVDTAGNFIREYLAPLSKKAGRPANLVQTADGGLIYSTTTLTWPESAMLLWRRGYVERLNSNWQSVMDTVFGTASPFMQQYDMQMLADESIVTCGYHYTGQDSIGRLYGWINKIAASGEHLWQRRYLPFFVPQYVDGEAVSMVKAPDGGFILAGQGRADGSPLPKGQYAWLLKVDSMGCLVPGCAVPVQELTKEKLYLKVWPNPASEIMYILFKAIHPLTGAELRLSDMQGRIRQKTVIPEGLSTASGELQFYLPLQDIEAGIYVLQVVNKGQLLAHEKIVVQK